MAKRRPQTGRDERQFGLFATPPQAVPNASAPAPARPARPDGGALASAVRSAARSATAPVAAGQAIPGLPEPPPRPARVKARARRRASPLPPRQLAERVSDAWYRNRAAGGIEIPAGVVAALALVRQDDPDGPDLAGQLLALDPGELWDALRQIWTCQWLMHPYLVEIAKPLHVWLNEREPDRYLVNAVQAVARAALEGGLLDITGHADPDWRCQDDMLGHALMALRPKSATAGLGAYYTGAGVAEMLTQMMMFPEDLKPGQRIYEPCCGTGGLVRAQVRMMREHGLDPHEFVWVLGDIDPLAAACAAVNVIVWDVGVNVLIDVGDSLEPGAGAERALKHRTAVENHYKDVMEQAAEAAEMAIAVRKALTLLDAVLGAGEETGEDTTGAAMASTEMAGM